MNDSRIMSEFSVTSVPSDETGSPATTVSSIHLSQVADEDNKLQTNAPLPSQNCYRVPNITECQVDYTTIPQVTKLWTTTQRIETYSGDHHLPHLRDARAAQLLLNPIREPRLPGPVPRFGLRSMSPLQDALRDLHSPQPQTRPRRLPTSSIRWRKSTAAIPRLRTQPGPLPLLQQA